MSSVVFDFRYLDDFENEAKRVRKSLDNRIEDYRDISDRVSNVSSSRSGLNTCNYYLKKKNQALSDKTERISAFRDQVVSVAEDAREADQRVANHVRESTETFHALTGIGVATGGVAAWISETLDGFFDWVDNGISAVIEGVRSAWDTVRAFYEKHKYVFDLVKDSLLLVAGVVALLAAIPTGGATLFFAGFALYGSFMEFDGSVAAITAHCQGNDELADQCAEFDGRKSAQYLGRGIDEVLGTGDFAEDTLGVAYSGVTIVSGVYAVGKTAVSMYNAFDFNAGTDVQVLTSKGSWMKAGKALFGVKSPNDPTQSFKTLNCDWKVFHSASDFSQALSVGANLGVSMEAASKLINISHTVTTAKTLCKNVDTIVTSFYGSASDVISAFTQTTSVGGTDASILDEGFGIYETAMGGN